MDYQSYPKKEKELVEAILKAEKEENTISGKKINTKNRKDSYAWGGP